MSRKVHNDEYTLDAAEENNLSSSIPFPIVNLSPQLFISSVLSFSLLSKTKQTKICCIIELKKSCFFFISSDHFSKISTGKKKKKQYVAFLFESVKFFIGKRNVMILVFGFSDGT